MEQKIRVHFKAQGTVKNPDGSTRNIELHGSKVVSEKEAKHYGYHPGDGSRNSR